MTRTQYQPGPETGHYHDTLGTDGATLDDIDLSAYQPLSAKDQASGYAGLDSGGKILAAQLPGAAATDVETAAAVAALSAVYQPLDSDLTAIAALATTSYGRALLALADQAALQAAVGAQPLDADLTAIAALTTTSYGRALLALADQAALQAAVGATGQLSYTRYDTAITNIGSEPGGMTIVPNIAAVSVVLPSTMTLLVRYEAVLEKGDGGDRVRFMATRGGVDMGDQHVSIPYGISNHSAPTQQVSGIWMARSLAAGTYSIEIRHCGAVGLSTTVFYHQALVITAAPES